jgi:hypothetical protein
MLSNTTTNERSSFFFLGTMLSVVSIALREGKHSLPHLSLLPDKWLLCSSREQNAAVVNEEHHDHQDNGQNTPEAEGILVYGKDCCLEQPLGTVCKSFYLMGQIFANYMREEQLSLPLLKPLQKPVELFFILIACLRYFAKTCFI